MFQWKQTNTNVTFSKILIPICLFSGKETDVAIVWIGAWRKSILNIWTAQQEFSLKYEVKLLAYRGPVRGGLGGSIDPPRILINITKKVED